MPMIDLEGCDDASITNNKTTEESLLKARNSKNLLVSGNEAGKEKKKHEVLSIKPGAWGISVDLKALYKNLVSKK